MTSDFRLTVPVLTLLLSTSCGKPPDDPYLRRVYDPKTGKLQQLQYDSNKNGRMDTWSYMDGTRICGLRLTVTRTGRSTGGRYYGGGQQLEKVGLSRANDGKVDAWAYAAPDGSVARMEISTRRDGEVSRTEFFEAGRLARAEEDGDGDGRVDKWETYREGALASVALDTTRRGKPDRRLVYAADGTVTVETDPAGTGAFKR